MNGLSPDLIERLREALLTCGPFDDYSALKHLFVDDRIYPWRYEIGYRPSSMGLVNETIYQLYSRRNRQGENALYLFLHVVRDRLDPADACHAELERLAGEVKVALMEPVPVRLERFATDLAPSAGPLERAAAAAEEEAPLGLPPASPRLRALGFEFDPFEWPEAEKIQPPQLLEQIFVAHPEYDDKIMSLQRSTALVAPRGGGKTAGRLRLETGLEQLQQEAFAPYASAKRQPVVPLVVVYAEYERLLPLLPRISLEVHKPLLLSALGRSILTFLRTYKSRFLDLSEEARLWWWSYLNVYLQGIPISFAVSMDHHLRVDWKECRARVSNPFTANASLKEILQDLSRNLEAHFGINGLYILVDGVDGYLETQTAENLTALLAPLLSALPLLSLPGVYWKFFLPDFATELVRHSSGYRTGRLDLLRIRWDLDSLTQLLQTRLVWASGGIVEQLDSVCEQNLHGAGIDAEQELARMALAHRLGPPRALLMLGRDLFHHSQAAAGQGYGLLTLPQWQQFLERVHHNLLLDLKEQVARLELEMYDALDIVESTLTDFNYYTLMLVQRGWDEVDFLAEIPATPPELARLFTDLLISSPALPESLSDPTIDPRCKLKAIIPLLVDRLRPYEGEVMEGRQKPVSVLQWLVEAGRRHFPRTSRAPRRHGVATLSGADAAAHEEQT